MRHIESKLQQTCVTWFRLIYPNYAPLLIAVPNGGKRNLREAQIMKAEGVTPGVADLLLLLPNDKNGSLAIEMKVGKGKQTDYQKKWQESFEAAGNQYQVCRTLDEFIRVIKDYLSDFNITKNG